MGHGGYSAENRTSRILMTNSVAAKAAGYTGPEGTMDYFSTLSNDKLFERRSINNAMSPYNLGIRESRDSIEHPASLAIIIALDVTGSMGSVPNFLVKQGLPDIMEKIVQKGVADPQILFLGVGDHECDSSPLQVSQFESSDDLLDKWLTDVYLEGGGGSNAGESYSLAWYTAAFHTSIDCFEKRGEKGFLFTIGDEPVLKQIPKSTLKKLIGGDDKQFEDFTDKQLYDKAREKYHVFHIHIKETGSGSRQIVMDEWKQLLADNCIIAESHNDVANLIADAILKNAIKHGTVKMEPKKEEKKEEIIL